MRRYVILLLLTVLVTAVFAVPEIFNYQGKLTDTDGAGINDTLDMTVNIYDGPDAGTATLLSTDALTDVPVVKGLFDIEYDVDLDQTELMGDLYMELIIDGSPLDPLVRIAAVPFALSAQYVDSAYYAVKADSLGNYVAADLMPNDLDGAYDQGGPGAGYLITADAGPVDIRTAFTGPDDGEALEIRTNDNDTEALYVYNAGAGPAIFCSGDLRMNGEVWSNADIAIHLDKNESVSDEMFYVMNDTGVTVFSVNEHGDAVILGELDPKAVTFQPQTTAPTGVEGKVYYDDADGKLKWHDGTDWQDFGSGAAGGDYIWDQDSAAQDADFWIENEGEFGVYMAATEVDLFTEFFEGTWPAAGWTITGTAWDRNDNWGRTNYAGGNGYCADADADANGGACDGHLQTPSIDLTTATNATLEFIASYNYIGGDSANVNISTDGGTTWIPLLHWVEDHDAYGPGEVVTISLDSYIGSNVLIDFYYFADSWDWWFMVDNVRVFTTEYSTPAPKIIANGPTGDIELMDPAGDVIFDGTGLKTPGGAGIVGYDNATSGLTATNVQDAIDEMAATPIVTKLDTLWAGDLSDRSDTIYALDNFFVNGELIADSIQADGDMIYLDDHIDVDGDLQVDCVQSGGGPAPTDIFLDEGFESAVPPTGWTQSYVNGTVDWVQSSGGHSGSYFAEFDGSGSGYATDLITPSMDITGYSTVYLNFWHKQEAWAGDQDTLRVFYKTSSAGSWTLLAEWTTDIDVWTEENLVLPSPSADYYLAFRGIEDYGYGVHVDDIMVYAITGPAPLAVNICDGDVSAEGDIEAASFTLDGTTITEWPSGGGGVENDTIWSEAGMPEDTIVTMANMKIHGELIADSIQAAGPTIEMDDDVVVHGDLDGDAAIRAVDVVASNNVTANTSMTLNGATITAWPGGGATGSLDAAYDYMAPGGGRVILADSGPVLIDGNGVPDTVLSVIGYNPTGPSAFFANLAGPTAIETMGDIWVHGSLISDYMISTPVITNLMGDSIFVESKLWAQEFVADTIEARNEYTYFKDAIWIEDSIWMDGAWHTTWGGGGAGQWEDAGTYKRVIGNDNIRAYETDDQYGIYAYNAWDDADHAAVHGYASQTVSADQNIIGVWGTAEGPNSTWGYAVGVLGSADETQSWEAVGVYARLTDDATTYPSTFENTALYADGGGLGYSGYFTGGDIILDDTLTANYHAYFANDIEIEDSLLFDFGSHIWYGSGSEGYGLYYSPDPGYSSETHNFMIADELAAQIFSGGIIIDTAQVTDIYADGDTVFVWDKLYAEEFVADMIEARAEYTYFKDAIYVEDSIWFDGEWRTEWGGGGIADMDTLWMSSGLTEDTMVAMAQFKVFGELIADSIQADGDVIELDDSIQVWGASGIAGNIRDYGTYYGYPLPGEEGISLIQDHGAAIPASNYSLTYADYRDDQLRGAGIHHLLGGFGSYDPTSLQYAATYGGIELTGGMTAAMGGLGVSGPVINSAVSGVSMDPLYYAGYFIGDVMMDGKAIVTDSLIVMGDAHIAGVLDPTGVGFDPVASNPLPTGVPGIFVNSADGRLYYDDGSGTPQIVDVGGTGNTLDEAYDEGGAGAGAQINATDGPVDIRTAYTGPNDGTALEVRTNDDDEGALYALNAGAGPAIYSSGDLQLTSGSEITNTGDVTVHLDINDNTDDEFIVKNGGGTDVFMVDENGNVDITGHLDVASITNNDNDTIWINNIVVGDEFVAEYFESPTEWLYIKDNTRILGTLLMDTSNAIIDTIEATQLRVNSIVPNWDDYITMGTVSFADSFYFDGAWRKIWPAGHTLQRAYDGGNTITTTSGNAVSITAGSGTALYVNSPDGNGIWNDANYWAPDGDVSLGTGVFHTNNGVFQSNVDFVAKIDANDDEDRSFFVRNSADNDVFEVQEDGDVFVDGYLNLSNITNPDGDSIWIDENVWVEELVTDTIESRGDVVFLKDAFAIRESLWFDGAWRTEWPPEVDLDTISGTHRDTIVVTNDMKIMGELIADSIQAVGEIIDMDDSVNVIGGVSLLDDSTYRTDWEPLYVITVGQDNADFQTVDDAMNAIAVNGWTRVLVDVAPGIYNLTTSVLIPAEVHLRGSGMTSTRINGTINIDGVVSRVQLANGEITITGDASYCHFSGTVMAGNSEDIATISNCLFFNRFGGGSLILLENGKLSDCIIKMATTHGGGNWSITDCDISQTLSIQSLSGMLVKSHIEGCDISNSVSVTGSSVFGYFEANYFSVSDAMYAIQVGEGAYIEVKANHFVDCLTGINVTEGGSAIVLSNDFIANIEYGVFANNPARIDILGNSFVSKGLMTSAIYINLILEQGIVKDNTIEGCALDAIMLSNCTPNFPVENNVIRGSGGNGIYLNGGTYQILRNTLIGNGDGSSTFDLNDNSPSGSVASYNVLDTVNPSVGGVWGGAFNTNSGGIIWVGGAQTGQLP